MPFVIACPKCSGRYSAPDQFRGQTVQCPSCSNSFVADDLSAREPAAVHHASATTAVRSAPKAIAATTFVTACTYCGQRFSAPANVHGQMVRCPGCGQSFTAKQSQQEKPAATAAAAVQAANPADWKWFEENFEPYKPPKVEKEEKRRPQVALNKNLFEAQPKRLRLAGRFTRLVAAWLDGFLIWAPAMLIFFSSLPSLPRVAPGESLTPQQISELSAVLGIAGGWLLLIGVINLICLAMRGQTLGKMVLGIKIVGSDGFPCFGRILLIRIIVMGLLKNIPFVGLIIAIVDPLMIFRDNRRCMHDEIADTIVVRAR